MINKGDLPKFLDVPIKGIPLYSVRLLDSVSLEIIKELHRIKGTAGLNLISPPGKTGYLFNDLDSARKSLKFLIKDICNNKKEYGDRDYHLEIINFYNKEVIYRSINIRDTEEYNDV